MNVLLLKTHSHVYLKGRALSLKVRKDKEHQAAHIDQKDKKICQIYANVAFCENGCFV